MEQPTNVDELFPSRFLRAADLKGKAYSLVIAKVVFEQMRDKYTSQNVTKGVVMFVGAQKGMVLNKTNAQRLAEICGSSSFSDWAGKRVVLLPGVIKGKDTILVAPAADKPEIE